MRVLLVANGFPPLASAGVESHTYHLARELRRAGFSVRVFCRDADLSAPMYTVRETVLDGIPVTRVVNNLLDVHAFEQTYRSRPVDEIFARLLAQFQPDVVHIQHMLALSVGCLEQSVAAGIPTVLTLHDYWGICPAVNLIRPDGSLCAGSHRGMNCFDCVRLVPSPAARLTRLPAYDRLHRLVPPAVRQSAYRWLSRAQSTQRATSPVQPHIDARVRAMRDLLGRADLITTPSRHLKNRYVDFGLEDSKIRVVPLGMDVARWLDVAREPRPEGAPLRFGYAGSLVPIKGADIIVRAFTETPGNMTLEVAGFDPPGNTYPARVRALAARDARITFLGSVPNHEMPGLFARWDALLIPTISEETFSFVAREALLAGLPVIASDRPVLPEIVRHGQNGFLVPPGDVTAWAARFRALRDDPAALRSLDPRAGTEFARTFADHAEEQIGIYRELRDNNRERRKDKGE